MAKSKSSIGRKYGWKAGKPNMYAAKLTTPLKDESELPREIDLRNEFPACYDQGRLGSCTANGIAALIERHDPRATPSRLFIYYNERAKEGTVLMDAGAIIADGIAVVNKYGVCPERENGVDKDPGYWWTYDDNTASIPFFKKAKFQKKPPKACYKFATDRQVLQSEGVPLNRRTVLSVLAAGRPFVFGFQVKESFESGNMLKTGVMPVPGSREQTLGGHAVVAIGYVLDRPMGDQGVKDWVLIRNSWGTDIYGTLHGNFWMPLNEVLCNPDMSSDAHTIDVVEK